jgi:hypothetical protein
VPEALPFRDLVLSADGAAAGILLVMDTDSLALENLSPDECMRLMGSVAVGRIVYTRQALPAVELVNFALVDGDIVIRTSAEGKLAAATRGAVVAFEADAVELDGQAGWSVAIVGQARAVSDAEEIGRLERVALTSWVPGSGGHFIRISPAIVNGRRVLRPAEVQAPLRARLSQVRRPRDGALDRASGAVTREVRTLPSHSSAAARRRQAEPWARYWCRWRSSR